MELHTQKGATVQLQGAVSEQDQLRGITGGGCPCVLVCLTRLPPSLDTTEHCGCTGKLEGVWAHLLLKLILLSRAQSCDPKLCARTRGDLAPVAADKEGMYVSTYHTVSPTACPYRKLPDVFICFPAQRIPSPLSLGETLQSLNSVQESRILEQCMNFHKVQVWLFLDLVTVPLKMEGLTSLHTLCIKYWGKGQNSSKGEE